MNDPVSLRRVWQSVLVTMTRDLCNNHPSHRKNRINAEDWVGSFPRASFKEVCQLAGYDERRVHSALSGLCKLHPQERKDFADALSPSIFVRSASK